MHAPWWKSCRFKLELQGGQAREINMPMEGNGYHYQAVEVSRCIKEGRLESDIMTLDESLSIMNTLDAIRAQWGLQYPMETDLK
jgi:hypothetical protein